MILVKPITGIVITLGSNEELHGYQWDPNYKEPFFEPATREEELLHQIVELNVESIPERDVE